MERGLDQLGMLGVSMTCSCFDRSTAEAEFERLLRAAGQRKLPRRAKGRTYPREVIPRRRKFPTRKRAQNTASRRELK